MHASQSRRTTRRQRSHQETSMSHLRTLLVAGVTISGVAAVIAADPPFPIAAAVSPSLRVDGAPQRLGNGTARTYVLYDPANRRVPIEVGVALSADALDGLPAPMSMSAEQMASMHVDTHERLLALPAQNPTPYAFVQLNWNPAGHEPPGIYDEPHFDFHFWTVPVEVRNEIVPSTPRFAEKAARYPAAEFRAPFYVDAATAAEAPPAAVTVPQMGMHWLDLRSPEFHGQRFTRTYIYGSWDGQLVFDEPMITRAYMAAKKDATDPAQRDEIIAIPTPTRRMIAGYYPNAYRITYDGATREYRIALTRLTWQE
jgi:hypothetical protein